MLPLNQILDRIVCAYKDILLDNLVGIYLHGSLAMNCFNPNTSDIDFLVVIKDRPSIDVLRELVEVLLMLSEIGPSRGFEMSVILEADARVFKYPTPFILHYSDYHKEKYLSQPDYICGGFEDTDLAAHVAIIKQRGRCLYGRSINQVFQSVPREYFIDSIKRDIASSKTDILDKPVYYVLNLCRVLCFLTEEKICSKKEGGEWAYASLPQRYKDIVESALASYSDTSKAFDMKAERLIRFADYMINEINMNRDQILI